MGELVDGKYRIVEQLGAGAMGVVFQARDERLERDVAVKLVRPAAASKPEARERFLAEARAMARVRHPNVVPIFDFGLGIHAPYLVMEYVEGVDLDTELERRRVPFSPTEAIAIMEKVGAGVEAIHSAGLVHRDIKPSNVLLGKDGRVMLGDFGIVGGLLPDESTGMPVGTPGFVAPELFALDMVGGGDGLEVTPTADVYALGSMAFELLTGEPTFNGATMVDIISAQLSGEQRIASDVYPPLTTAFDAALAAALERDPRRRTRDVQRLLGDLRQGLKTVSEPSFGRRIVAAIGVPERRNQLREWLEREFPHASVVPVADGRQTLHGVNARSTVLLFIDLDIGVVAAKDIVALLRSRRRFDAIAIVVVADAVEPGEWQALRDIGVDAVALQPLDEPVVVALARGLVSDPHRIRSARARNDPR